MSSMRNAVQRRQHRERGQLEGREKWGILEKHKVGIPWKSCRHSYQAILGVARRKLTREDRTTRFAQKTIMPKKRS